jgi:O-phospho-L-seryl-tRNASec:L-selenocysteinyl-tRNA synthase
MDDARARVLLHGVRCLNFTLSRMPRPPFQDLALMDSNNFLGNVGVGEREGRVFSSLVAQRHYRMSHGIGRSGDVAAVQPKAAGSSLMVQLVNLLVLDALKVAGLVEVRSALTVPMATGLSISVVLLGLRLHWQAPPSKRVVLWSRIDQKSCFKAIVTAGFDVVVVPLAASGDELRTDAKAFEAALVEHGDAVFCCITTTSCFAPRAPDDVEAVARLCKQFGVGHVINNAYGLQCRETMKRISRAMRVGRIDALVSSTDKNFMVPVGGAVISGQDKDTIEAIGRAYPGRASSAPLMDVFITLLSLGEKGYRSLLAEREALSDYFRERLREVATAHGERLLETPNNRISFGMSLDGFAGESAASSQLNETYLGSMLFTRNISGTRVIKRQSATKTIGGADFLNYGASCDAYPHSYLTAACAVGQSRDEVDAFTAGLSKAMVDLQKKRAKQAAKRQQEQEGGADVNAAPPQPPP